MYKVKAQVRACLAHSKTCASWDRYRTAAMRLQIGPIKVGVNMFTGDPGLNWDDRKADLINGRETYVYNSATSADPDKYRSAPFYLGIGPFRIGRNSERIRHIVQNRFAHDIMMGGKSPYFKVDKTTQMVLALWEHWKFVVVIIL